MTETLEHPVTVSDRAAKRIAKIIESEPEGTALRVSVEGGGCSGLQYKYDLVTDPEDDDLVLRKKGI
ncbi:iron-sulfur cluster assembly accessory protein, partial [Roseibium sp.]|uniref:HesB/IscA family protein n=1 Tax=Roseibium sp. TaxID=1936156 RepID=UPI00329971A0